jgi:hypothetical protein
MPDAAMQVRSGGKCVTRADSGLYYFNHIITTREWARNNRRRSFFSQL